MSKRSRSIALLGLPVVAALAACGPDEGQTRVSKYDSYATLEDCVKEWEVKACELTSNPNTGDLVWVGPPYSDNHKPVYKDESGQTHERRASHGVTYMPIFIPHTAYVPTPAYTPQSPVSARSSVPYSTSNPPYATAAPTRAYVPTPTPSVSAPRASVPSVSSPSVASRGGFGSTSVSVGSSAGA